MAEGLSLGSAHGEIAEGLPGPARHARDEIAALAEEILRHVHGEA